MNYNRKDFLKLSGGIALASIIHKDLFIADEAKKIKSFGLQLYTLRDDLPKDVKGILKQVANAGYKFVESYEHADLGMFWGLGNTGFKKYMDELGIKIISSHCDPTKDFQKKVDDAAAIGMKYLIYNWPSQHEQMDEYKKNAELFNKWGELCKKSGLRFANHNYDKSFELLGGQYPMDVLMQNTDPGLVDYQMDLHWVVFGGADPIAWLKKYPTRFKLCHIKDRIKGAIERDASCTIGGGSIDFPKILKTASSIGMQYYIVEQERYDNTTPLKAIVADADYMKRLRI